MRFDSTVVVVFLCICVLAFVGWLTITVSKERDERIAHIYEQIEQGSHLTPGMYHMSCGCLVRVNDLGEVIIERLHQQKDL